VLKRRTQKTEKQHRCAILFIVIIVINNPNLEKTIIYPVKFYSIDFVETVAKTS
jgi:hypothetical protein